MRGGESTTTAAYLWRAGWVAAVFLATLVAWAASAEGARPAEEEGGEELREIAVVSLGATTATTWVVEIEDVLDDGHFAIVHGEQLQGRLTRRRVGGVPPGAESRLDEVESALQDGIARFHGRGNEAAIEALATPFERGLTHPEAIAQRPAFAERLFRAGMILVRAYRNLGETEGARGIARDLYRYLPGLEPSLAEAKLEDIHFYYRERAAVAATGAKLTLPVAGEPDCRPYLNGTPLEGGFTKVDSDRTHFASVRCGTGWGPIWRVELRPGEYATVPISQDPPRQFELAPAADRSLRRAAEYLRVVRHWAGVSATVGIGRPGEADGAPYVIMRAPEDGEVRWTRVDKRGQIEPALRHLLPSVTEQPVAAIDASVDRRRWLDWTLVGAGGAGLTAGVALAAAAETGRGGPCGAAARSPVPGAPVMASDGCDGPRTRRLTAGRIGYTAAFVAGAGLTTWGLWRHLRRDSVEAAEHTAMGPRIRVRPIGEGAEVSFQFAW